MAHMIPPKPKTIEEWIVNSKLNNFFKVIHLVLNWC